MGWIHGDENATMPSAPERTQEEIEASNARYQQIMQRKRSLVERWNAVGQYIRVGSICLPFSIGTDDGTLCHLFEHGGWHETLMKDVAYISLQHGNQKFTIAYRRIDAPDDAPWITHEEYRKQS